MNVVAETVSITQVMLATTAVVFKGATPSLLQSLQTMFGTQVSGKRRSSAGLWYADAAKHDAAGATQRTAGGQKAERGTTSFVDTLHLWRVVAATFSTSSPNGSTCCSGPEQYDCSSFHRETAVASATPVSVDTGSSAAARPADNLAPQALPQQPAPRAYLVPNDGPFPECRPELDPAIQCT